MNSVLSISLNIGLLIFLCLSIITIIHLIINNKKYGIKFISILNIMILLFFGIIFQILYYFSMNTFFSDVIDRVLIKLLIVIECISLLFFSLAFSLLKQYGKIPMNTLLFFIFIFSLLVGNLILEDSIVASFLPNSDIEYYFSTLTKIISFTFKICIVIFLIYNTIKIRIITSFERFGNGLIVYAIILSTSIFLFLNYIIFELVIIRVIFIVFLWISITIQSVFIILNPKMFLRFTNKIYFIHIYHKTGILLYSYKFEKSIENSGESKIWGNILIGINHILSEFTNKTDQIDILQTKNADIFVNYSNKYGFAVLAITNQKNSYIEKLVNSLTKEFKEQYKNELLELQDINKIINVSEFKEAKRIIEKNFKIYL